MTETINIRPSRDYLRILFAQTAELLDSEHEEEAKHFLVRLFQLNELLRAFRSSPGGKIGGDDGVAARLQLSRNAVYHWLNAAGLTARQVRQAPDLVSLLYESPVMRSTLHKLLPGGLHLEPVRAETGYAENAERGTGEKGTAERGTGTFCSEDSAK